jgi:hypothetical protein
MHILKSPVVSVWLDTRWPRIIRFETPDRAQHLVGERQAIAPRVYLYEKGSRCTCTSDDAGIDVVYTCAASAQRATYHAVATCNGQAAVEFDIVCELSGADLVVRLERVREQGEYRLLTVRLARLVSATSCDPESLLVTCGWQGRLLDPRKCKPQLIDYSWVSFIARLCGAAYRPGLMVTIDIPGFEDLLIQEVWQYTRIAGSETLAGLGAELMYRQRQVEGPREYRFLPPPEKRPKLELLDEPLLCAPAKEVRLHAIVSPAGTPLDWTDAARYFQSLVPRSIHCEPRYDDTLVYKIQMAQREKPMVSVNECEAIVRRIQHLTDGMKQVCYLTFFQYKGGENGFPEMFEVYPPLGTKDEVRALIAKAGQWNAIVSFHQNLNVYENESASFNPDYTLRTFNGRMFCGWVLPDFELFSISMPVFREEAGNIIDRLVKEYGIHTTYHLDTFSCSPYLYDAHPRHPFNAAQFVQAHMDILAAFNRRGIDITSEGLTDPYVGKIGHVWALFNWGTVWEGEEPVPFANYIYHGAASWNSGKATDEEAILSVLLQGGAAGVEAPFHGFDPIELVDTLHLLQIPYALLRHRRWTGYRRTGKVSRVDYAAATPGGGSDSYIEVDEGKPGYRVVVDGKLIAEDFTTVYPGPQTGTVIAFSRKDGPVDWTAPAGWRDGPVPAVALTEYGPGLHLDARVEKGRLHLTLKAHQPVRVGPTAG